MRKSDILISRDALPEVTVDGLWVNGPTMGYPASSVHARMLREQACERLAIAARIDKVLAEQAEEKLISEGNAIADAMEHHHRFGESQWMTIARAAREVYGVK